MYDFVIGRFLSSIIRRLFILYYYAIFSFQPLFVIINKLNRCLNPLKA